MCKKIVGVVLLAILIICNLYSSIIINGNLSDNLWNNAKCVTGFKTYDPISGNFPPESTVIYYTFDDGAIYFAFKCYEKSPMNPLTTNKDDVYRDEFISIYLDTYNDKCKAYVFNIYPTGENEQALYTGATLGNLDFNWKKLGSGTFFSQTFSPPFLTLHFQPA